MITAIIRNKENTLVLELPHSIYDIYEKLQSIGIMQPPKQIPLIDNEDEDIGVKLFSESDFGQHLLLTLNEKNTIADANMLTLVIGAASEDIKEELEQNILYDQYDSMDEVISAVRQMTQDAGPVKAVFFCPLVGNIDEGDGDILAIVFPLSAHTGSDHFTVFIIPVNIEILLVLLQLLKVFAVQPLSRFAERCVFQAAHRHPFYGQFSGILVFQTLFALCGILGLLGGILYRLVTFDASFQRVNIPLPARIVLQCDIGKFILSARIVRPVFIHIGVLAVDGQRCRIPIAGKRSEVLLGRGVIAICQFLQSCLVSCRSLLIAVQDGNSDTCDHGYCQNRCNELPQRERLLWRYRLCFIFLRRNRFGDLRFRFWLFRLCFRRRNHGSFCFLRLFLGLLYALF